jgi:hypothetical protein
MSFLSRLSCAWEVDRWPRPIHHGTEVEPHISRRLHIRSIYVHDGRLLRVVEDTTLDTVTMHVELPASEWADNFVPRLLVFDDVHGYQVFWGRLQVVPPFSQ